MDLSVHFCDFEECAAGLALEDYSRILSVALRVSGGFIGGLYKKSRHVCRTQAEKTSPESVSSFIYLFYCKCQLNSLKTASC